MKNFVVFVEGNNFNVMLDCRVQRVGFFASRRVMAESEAEAGKIVIDQIINEPELRNSQQEGKDSKSTVVVKMVHEMPLSHSSTYHGFTYFPMDE